MATKRNNQGSELRLRDGEHADIDGLYREQSKEMDPKRREAILHKIQQLMHERAMFGPIVEAAFLSGYGVYLGRIQRLGRRVTRWTGPLCS